MPKRVIYHQIPYFKRFGCPSTVHKTKDSTKILPNCTQETQFELNDDPTTLIQYEETLTNCVNEMLFEHVWPVELTYQESGSILASFPDVPEAITEEKGVQDALEQAQDCLVADLGGYVSAWRIIPKPSPSIPARRHDSACTTHRGQDCTLQLNACSRCK